MQIFWEYIIVSNIMGYHHKLQSHQVELSFIRVAMYFQILIQEQIFPNLQCLLGSVLTLGSGFIATRWVRYCNVKCSTKQYNVIYFIRNCLSIHLYNQILCLDNPIWMESASRPLAVVAFGVCPVLQTYNRSAILNNIVGLYSGYSPVLLQSCAATDPILMCQLQVQVHLGPRTVRPVLHK